MKVVKRVYKKKRAQPGPEQVVEFESDRISLDIPIAGTGDHSGWEIIPLTRPVVSVCVCVCVCVCA